MPRDYAAYLAAYGDAYGDMSDPVKRAETIAALRRRDALTLASACRELRAEIARMPIGKLFTVERTTLHQLSDHCRTVRPEHIRRCDLHRLRMVHNEMTRRGILTFK
ncbi:hypothetical protein Lfu02_55140 [Longispora fulva]|nr:hypothetical protein Lfu02_55140 [Longispora fulva]